MNDPIFKGCTRPPMLCGVPFVPFILCAGVFFLLGLWGSVFLGIGALLVSAFLALLLMLILRAVTLVDDQRLLQYLVRVRLGQIDKSMRGCGLVYGHFGRSQ